MNEEEHPLSKSESPRNVLISEQKPIQTEGRKALKQILSSLIDAMKDAQRMHEKEDKVREIEETSKRSLLALDKLKEQIRGLVLSLQDALGKEQAEDLEKQVSGLSVVAIDLSRKKIEDKYWAELDDAQLALESEWTKTFKSIEAFLATLPFDLLDKSISLKLLNKTYAANARYNCASNIQFEFSLDCKRSTVLNKEFKLTSPEGEIKIPISVGKSWRKKEPTPDYEDLDHYILSAAELTGPHLTATYTNPEKSTAIRMINSKRDYHASLTVEYQSPDKKVNVSSEPALKRFLNSEQIVKSSDVLERSILELESYKVDLANLVSDEKTVFMEEKLGVQEFLTKAWGIIGPEIEANLRKQGSAGEGNDTSEEQDLDRAFVRQKIISLGKNGTALLASLKLS
jgi:hypothetical protein